MILALIYLKRRSLPAVMFTHFTVDFVPNVLLPLLGVLKQRLHARPTFHDYTRTA